MKVVPTSQFSSYGWLFDANIVLDGQVGEGVGDCDVVLSMSLEVLDDDFAGVGASEVIGTDDGLSMLLDVLDVSVVEVKLPDIVSIDEKLSTLIGMLVLLKSSRTVEELTEVVLSILLGAVIDVLLSMIVVEGA